MAALENVDIHLDSHFLLSGSCALQLITLCVFCAVAGLADENGVGQNAGQEAESQSNRK